MKTTIFFAALIILIPAIVLGQEVDKMNKSELREYAIQLSSQLDALKSENNKLQASLTLLNEQDKITKSNYVNLQKKNEQNESEIQRLSNVITQIQNEKEKKIGELDQQISSLSEEIKTLKDSISQVQSSNSASKSSLQIPSDDFLNNYFFDQIPLNNETFHFSLSKVLLGKLDTYYESLKTLPELLDAKNLVYWGVKSPVTGTGPFIFNELLEPKTAADFSQQLPTIEILKNKLFTLKYSDGTEEAFLFNTRQLGETENNYRNILEIKLANEDVDKNGTNNHAQDIVWQIFAIENECYLALTAGQLQRLNLKLKNSSDGIQVKQYGEIRVIRPDDYALKNNTSPYVTTGVGIYISRTKDKYMDTAKYLDYNNIIYLFKLVR